MFVVNGLPAGKDLTVKSNYWIDANVKHTFIFSLILFKIEVDGESANTLVTEMTMKSIDDYVFTQFTDKEDYNKNVTYFRTPSQDWLQDNYPQADDRKLTLSAVGYPDLVMPIDIHEHTTKGVYCYEKLLNNRKELECKEVAELDEIYFMFSTTHRTRSLDQIESKLYFSTRRIVTLSLKSSTIKTIKYLYSQTRLL